MNETVQFIQKHQGKSVLLDANLLLVYVVGCYDQRRLADFRHTKQYVEDFVWIERLIGVFKVIHTTPNILTEVSNLGKGLGCEFFDVLKVVIETLQEDICLSKNAVKDTHFRKIGLTDSGITALTATCPLVITADWPLYSILRSRNIDAININHLRQIQWANS